MTKIYHHIYGWHEKVAGELLGNDLLEVFHQLYTPIFYNMFYLFLYLSSGSFIVYPGDI
jgi:hypothetical protein